ncbi:MAG: RNA chaperone Hfq [bacterium]
MPEYTIIGNNGGFMTRIGEFQKNKVNNGTKAIAETNTHKNSPINIQDQLLNQLRRDKTTVSIELLSGTVVQGVITGFDSYSIMLENPEKQLIYKHGIVLIRWSAS